MKIIKCVLLFFIVFLFYTKVQSAPFHPHLSWDDLNGSSTTMVVCWKTTADVTSKVKYGTTSGNYPNVVTGSFFWSSVCNYYIHTVKITNLTPETQYYYRCGEDADGWSTERTFKTGPIIGSNKNIRFISAADTRFSSNPNVEIDVQKIEDLMQTVVNASFIVFGGDIVSNPANQSEWDTRFNIYEDLISCVPFFSAEGNHDTGVNYYDQFVFPGNEKWYSFNYGNAHFTFLQLPTYTSTIPIGSAQYNWLKNDLETADNDSNIKWKFVIFHAPPYSKHSSGERQTNILPTICPLFDQYKVDVVFNGHNHLYERSKKMRNIVSQDEVMENGPDYNSSVEGTVYITVGTAGAPVYSGIPGFWTAYSLSTPHYGVVDIDNTNNKLYFHAYNASNTLIDKCTISKAGADVGKWEVYETTLTASGSYTNPYTQCSVQATFTGPTKTITISGFWDGGNTWKVRVAPTEVGTWSYTTSSSDSGLNGKTGSFNCIASGKKGFVIRDPANNFAFKRSEGKNIFLMGDTGWNSFSTWNDGLTYSIFQQVIDTRAAQKFNFERSYVFPFYADSSEPAHYNEGGRGFEPWNPDNLNPSFFQYADRRVAYANSKGITMNLLFGSDQTNMTAFFGWGNGKMERWIRYVCARYSAYDICWEGRAEFEEQRDTTPGYITLAESILSWINTYDPYGHVQSMHTLDSCNELGNNSNLDWIMHQSKNWGMITSDRSYNKPVMNEEYLYENREGDGDANTQRNGTYNVMTAGATGLAYGNTLTLTGRGSILPLQMIKNVTSPGTIYMTYLYNFWITTKYWKLVPDNSIVKSGTASACAVPGEEYILYLPSGGSVSVDLSAAPGTLNTKWYNPRAGTYQGQTTVKGGATRSFTAPDTNDWVLYIGVDTTPPADTTSNRNKSELYCEFRVNF